MKTPITLIKSALSRIGGLEKYTWQIAKELCTNGSPVTLLTTGTISPPFHHPLLHIVSFPIQHLLSVLNVLHFDRACTQWIRAHPTPIVFSLDRNRSQTHLRAGNGSHIAYLKRRSQEEGWLKGMSFAINPLHNTLLKLERTAFEDPNLKVLFTNSHMVKEEILSFYDTDPAKIQVVHNGVEWNQWQTPFDEWQTAKERELTALSLDPACFQLLFIGHNFRRKGLDKLLGALSLLKNEPFQLSVVGKDKNLPFFQQLAKSYGIDKKVFFFGQHSDPVSFYQIADALVIPSLYDPFANVTVEALAMGVFVLSSSHNGGKEILTPENGEEIISLTDASAFSRQLKRVFAQPKTKESAERIRNSVQYLDFECQLSVIRKAVLNNN